MTGRRKTEGTRLTKQRQAILDVFADEKVHLSAEEVFMLVKAVQPGISLGTVYRNLDLLTRQGVLSQFILADGTRKYERASEHHHHLICINCGGAEDIPDCPLNQKIKSYTKEKNFRVVRHSFEVYGICADCQKKIRNQGD